MSLNLSRWLLPVLLLLTVTGLVISPAMAQDEVADDPPAAADAEPADEPDAAPVGGGSRCGAGCGRTSRRGRTGSS